MRGTPKKLGRSQRARINAILNESRLTVLHDGRANAAQTGVSEPVWLVNTTDHSWRSLTIESQSLSNLDGSLRYVSAVPFPTGVLRPISRLPSRTGNSICIRQIPT